jgi:DNA sulfur modification protein DndD
MKHENNADTPILDKEQQLNVINRIFIPLSLRPYALLQGESMDRLVDLSSKQALSNTIDTLAGISVLKGICEIAKKMAKKAEALYKQVDSQNSSNNKAKLLDTQKRDSFQQRKEELLEHIENAEAESAAAKAKKEELDAYISNSKRRNQIRLRLERINNEIADKEAEIEKIETSITKRIFDDENPWLLMGLGDELDTFKEKREKYVGELAVQNNDGALVIMLPEGSPDTSSLKRMLENEICEVCGQPASKHSKAWEHIKLILERPKKVSTTRNDFGQFYGALDKSASYYSLTIPRIEDKIEKIKDALDDTKDELKELLTSKEEIFTELNNAGGNVDNSEFDDKALVTDFDSAVTTIKDKEHEISNLQSQISTLDSSIEKLNAQLKKYGKNSETEKFEDFFNLLKSIEIIINDTKEKIFDRTIKTLEQEANIKYKQLTEGNQSSGGKLVFKKEHDVVNVSIRDVNNGVITGLGTGFQRMKQLAIVMAIISSKIGNEQKFDYPFISDAPFSEFGGKFISNFFKVAPGVFSQCIIMIKELYDPDSKDYLTALGREVLADMQSDKLPGTFYVNVIEEKADTTGLVTSHKCYKD